jgi:NADPH-dependent 2,4-dienoyl-CoA reductase/sulfur reductase-like enzyme/peroxiredoxin family protein/rhodanese-related sulfurtransferase/TusA-related sulfurtransferase
MGIKTVIAGGVAGGMSCAARLRRLDETAEIVVFEKGNDVSFANCGMPYFLGGVISDRETMLIQTPKGLEDRYGFTVRVRHEVLSIDRDAGTVTVKNLETGSLFEESYDRLVLSTGAAPFRPPIPGSDGRNVSVLSDLSDMDRIFEAAKNSKRVTIVGAGFIGLELAENFQAKGLDVTVVEMQDQVLPPFDREMTEPILQQLRLHGVTIHLNDTAEAIDDDRVILKSGAVIESDLVCLSIGVRPTSRLAAEAGLELGPRGHIHVNGQMRTSDHNIYAVGDVVEIADWVTGEITAVPLAGPANRQGRIAADNICGRDSSYRGTQGTAIVKVFGLAAAMTGQSEKRLKALGRDYRRLYIHPMQHAGYYPGAQPVSIKLLFSPDGVILGAQVVGSDGVKSIIDTLSTAMRGEQKTVDLEHLELAYSPQWGGAKDPVNMAGFAATNILKGDMDVVEADAAPKEIFWVDVRTADEIEAGLIPGAHHIPLDELRHRIDELPKDREIGLCCAVGLRGYIGARFLSQRGYRARTLNGGYRTWSLFHPEGNETTATAEPATASVSPDNPAETVKLDVCGLQCPGPIAKVKEAALRLSSGEILEVVASDPGFASDIPAWCRATGNSLLDVKPSGPNYVARIAIGTGVETAKTQEPGTAGLGTTVVLFSSDLDKALAAFIIANGTASMDRPATIFFTFWGLNVLRREKAAPLKKTVLEHMFGFMMPRGPRKLKLSKMHMGGMGTAMIKKVMRDKSVMTLPELIASARENGVRFVACAMSMDLMGIQREELIDGVEIAGVGGYLGAAGEGNVNLFV